MQCDYAAGANPPRLLTPPRSGRRWATPPSLTLLLTQSHANDLLFLAFLARATLPHFRGVAVRYVAQYHNRVVPTVASASPFHPIPYHLITPPCSLLGKRTQCVYTCPDCNVPSGYRWDRYLAEKEPRNFGNMSVGASVFPLGWM